MEVSREKVYAIRKAVKSAFGESYEITLSGGRLRIRYYCGNHVSAALISLVSDLGAVFDGCILYGGSVCAVFII